MRSDGRDRDPAPPVAEARTAAPSPDRSGPDGLLGVQLAIASGRGVPLPAGVRDDMENRFGGQDFSDVRVHTDGAAHASATALGANAYTVGSNIVFRKGGYDPGSGTGRHTLAHELTHVLQQRAGPVDGVETEAGVQVSDPADPFERAAVATADRVMSRPPEAPPEPPPASLLTLQGLAGNQAVTRLVAQRSARCGVSTVQREPKAAGATGVPFRGQMFTTDAGQMRRLLETLVGERGQDAAETLVYAFLNLSDQDKMALALQSVDVDLIKQVQAVVGPELKKLQEERGPYLDKFREDTATAARELLDTSLAELKKERDTYDPEKKHGPESDAKLEGLREAAKALAAKRRATDAAAAKAKEAFEAMRTQLQPKASPGGTFVPGPIMPYFPDPALRQEAGRTNEAWFTLEQEYAAARSTHEKQFPVLAMYASNEDGKAADRLADLPTSMLFADHRMRVNICEEIEKRAQNNRDARRDLNDAEKIWSLPKMIDLALRTTKAEPYKEKWVRAKAAQVRADEAELARLIAAITIGIAIAATVLTVGAAAAPAGTAAATVLTGAAAIAQTGSTALTIAVAYKELQDYRSKTAESDTALDKANSIASEDPSLLWLAITLAGVILEVAALKAAFTSLRGSITAYRQTRNAAVLAEAVGKTPNVPAAAAESITGRVVAEAANLPPPAANPQAAAQALERLSTFDKIPVAERGQVVMDALGGTNVADVLKRTGKGARELLEAVGEETVAGQRLQAALTRQSFDEFKPQLTALGLSEEAAARVVGRQDVYQIKGQLLEEVLEVEVTKTLDLDPADKARKALMRGADAEGPAEFIRGGRISDTQGAQLTDGILGVLREAEDGTKEIVVIRAFEAKAGKAAKQALSREAATKLAELSAKEQAEIMKDSAKILQRRRPDLASTSIEDIIANHKDDVLEVAAEKFPQTSQFGQATKTSQRLGIDQGLADEVGDIPAEILVDNVRHKVRFPGAQGRPRITGVLPKDLKPGRLPAKVSKEQGVKFDMMNVKGIDQEQLTTLSNRIGAAKGLKPK